MKENRTQLCTSYNPNCNPWTADFQTGIISKVDKDKREYTYVAFKGMQENNYANYHDVIEVDGRLFLLPNMLTGLWRIIVLQPETLEETRIELENFKLRASHKNEMLFTSMVRIDEYIYMIPYAYPAIVRVNTKTLCVEYINAWREEIDERIDKACSYGYFISRQYVVKDGYLYIPFCIISAVLRINLATLEEEIISLNTNSGGYSCIAEWKDNLLLLTGAGRDCDWLYLWDEDEKLVKKTWKMQSTPNDFSVLKMLKSKNGDIYLFPFQNWGYVDLDICCLKADTLELVNTNLLNEHKDNANSKYLWGDEIIYADWIDENTMLYVTGKDFLWHEYNVETHEYTEYEVSLNTDGKNYDRVMKDYRNALIKNRTPFSEQQMGLQEFVQCIES